MNSSMQTLALSMTNILSSYFFILGLDLMSFCHENRSKSRVTSRKLFSFNSNCYSFIIICNVPDTCLKFSKRSGLLEDIQNLRINRQRLQEIHSGKNSLTHSEKICLHTIQMLSSVYTGLAYKKKFTLQFLWFKHQYSCSGCNGISGYSSQMTFCYDLCFFLLFFPHQPSSLPGTQHTDYIHAMKRTTVSIQTIETILIRGIKNNSQH